MDWIVAIPHLLSSGVGNLASYLAAHVLLCSTTGVLYCRCHDRPDPAGDHPILSVIALATSYPAAALAGSVLAVCSAP